MNPPTIPAAPPRPRRLGCWFYGCTTLLVLVVVGVVGVILAVRALAKNFRDNYTSTQPLKMERVELPPAEWTNLQQRIQAFSKALDQGESHELVLSERELNAFIDTDPKFKEVADRIQATIQGEQIGGQVSFPLPNVSFFKWTGLGGRYVNGHATFEVDLDNGELEVMLREMTVNNKPIPKEFAQEFQKKNLAQDMQQDADTQAAIKKYDSIKVTNSTLVLKSKAAPPRTEPAETPK